MVAEEAEEKPPVRQGRAKEMFWRKMLGRFAQSGLTQVEFCKREGLNASNLCWWKREIASRDAAIRKSAPPAKRDKEAELSYWRKMVERFNASDLSKDDFCAKQGIKPAAFCWWRGEVQRRERARSEDFARPVVSSEKMFVPVQVTEASMSRSLAAPIAEIELSTRTVRVFQAATTEHLLILVRLVKELSFDR